MIPIGTRIRFKKDLDCPANEDHPAFIYARKGELGIIVAHLPEYEGYWVRTNSWPNSFGASDEEFEVVNE